MKRKTKNKRPSRPGRKQSPASSKPVRVTAPGQDFSITHALQQAGQEISQQAKKAEKAAEPKAEDLALTAKIKAKLAADPGVSALHIDVDTQEHVVTLSGRVSTAQERDQAVSIARHTDGVKAVLDRLVAGSEPMLGTGPSPAPGR